MVLRNGRNVLRVYCDVCFSYNYWYSKNCRKKIHDHHHVAPSTRKIARGKEQDKWKDFLTCKYHVLDLLSWSFFNWLPLCSLEFFLLFFPWTGQPVGICILQLFTTSLWVWLCMLSSCSTWQPRTCWAPLTQYWSSASSNPSFFYPSGKVRLVMLCGFGAWFHQCLA